MASDDRVMAAPCISIDGLMIAAATAAFIAASCLTSAISREDAFDTDAVSTICDSPIEPVCNIPIVLLPVVSSMLPAALALDLWDPISTARAHIIGGDPMIEEMIYCYLQAMPYGALIYLLKSAINDCRVRMIRNNTPVDVDLHTLLHLPSSSHIARINPGTDDDWHSAATLSFYIPMLLHKDDSGGEHQFSIAEMMRFYTEATVISAWIGQVINYVSTSGVNDVDTRYKHDIDTYVSGVDGASQHAPALIRRIIPWFVYENMMSYIDESGQVLMRNYRPGCHTVASMTSVMSKWRQDRYQSIVDRWSPEHECDSNPMRYLINTMFTIKKPPYTPPQVMWTAMVMPDHHYPQDYSLELRWREMWHRHPSNRFLLTWTKQVCDESNMWAQYIRLAQHQRWGLREYRALYGYLRFGFKKRFSAVHHMYPQISNPVTDIARSIPMSFAMERAYHRPIYVPEWDTPPCKDVQCDTCREGRSMCNAINIHCIDD